MRRCLLLILLAGCNQVFGLDETVPKPEADAAPDAPPPSCPAHLEGAPTFAPATVSLATPCISYTRSVVGEIAVAECGPDIAYAPLDSNAFSPLPMFLEATEDVLQPRLSPDGTELFALVRTSVVGVGVYRKDPANIYAFVQRLPVPARDLVQAVSTPSAGPEKRVIVASVDSDTNLSTFTEWTDGGTGSWTEVRRETINQLGLAGMLFPQLSADGLRLVFNGTVDAAMDVQILYRERQTLGEAFGPWEPIVGLPPLQYYPFLTEDCARLYFNGRDTVSYVSQ